MEARRESGCPQWRRSRISSPETKDQAERIAERLGSVAKELNLESYYPKERIAEIVESSTHLAVNHELKEEFFRDPRKCMFLMGIAEEWETTKGLRERRHLLDVLSIVAGDLKRRKTHSGKVARLRKKGLERGVEFDPLTDRSSTYWSELLKAAKRDIDRQKTIECNAQVDRWDGSGILAHVRSVLKITPETERPVEFIVLELSREETSEAYGIYSVCNMQFDAAGGLTQQTIILSSEWEEDVEHEYAHSQSKGFLSGTGGLLDRGLEEALTESATSSPEDYPGQRKVFSLLKTDIHGFRTIAYRAYIGGRKRDILSMDRLLIRTYGLRGRLAVARMTAWDPGLCPLGRIGECLTDPPLVKSLLHQLKGKGTHSPKKR